MQRPPRLRSRQRTTADRVATPAGGATPATAVPAVLGHEQLLERLCAFVREDALHHALLFEGPAGVGKRLVAQYLSLFANCEDQPDGPPCGRCNSCVQILAGTHPDIIVVEPRTDRASRTIALEDVREVIRQAAFRRYSARHRFVVIDPAEAMQPAAANALLKTLEEPNPGTGFILVCANAGALLPTIRSRCQRIRFGVVDVEAITKWLIRLGHEDKASQAAGLSLGCPGRALTLASGDLSDRLTLRNELISALSGESQGRFDWSGKLTNGPRAVWRARVEHVLEVLEELLRDIAIHGAGANQALLHDDLSELTERWATAVWPDGATRIHARIQETRANLAAMVSGKLALDALLASVAGELGSSVQHP